MTKLLGCLVLVILFFWACNSGKRYPCPSYQSKLSATYDSTGAFTGGYRHNKDRKTGLIKKKKNKRLLDKRGKASLF